MINAMREAFLGAQIWAIYRWGWSVCDDLMSVE